MEKNQTNNSKNSVSAKPLPSAHVNFVEAKELADLVSIIQDLKFAIDSLIKLDTIIEKDDLLARALWSSSLIAYRRCFNYGKRYGLKKDIYKKIKGDPLGLHEYFINQSNKLIAHSVNPFEQIVIDIQLSHPENGKKIVGVSYLSINLICTDKEGIKNFKDLSIFACKYAVGEAKKCEKKVLSIAKKIPIEDLYKKKRSRIVIPGPVDAGNVRK